MGVFMSMGNAVARMAAQNAVETNNESYLLRDAAQARKEAAITQEQVDKDVAAALQQVQGTLSIAMDVVNIAQAGAKVGEAGKNLADRNQALPQLRQDVAAARADLERGIPASESPAFQRLKGVSLGDRTVGERFNDRQLEVLVRGDTSQLSDAQLRDMGFTDPGDFRLSNERKELRGWGGQGEEVSAEARTNRSADFIFGHRKTSQEDAGRLFRDNLQKALKECYNTGINGAVEGTRSSLEEDGKKAHDDVGKMTELQGHLRDTSTEKQKAADRLDLDMLRNDRQQFRSSKK